MTNYRSWSSFDYHFTTYKTGYGFVFQGTGFIIKELSSGTSENGLRNLEQHSWNIRNRFKNLRIGSGRF